MVGFCWVLLRPDMGLCTLRGVRVATVLIASAPGLDPLIPGTQQGMLR